MADVKYRPADLSAPTTLSTKATPLYGGGYRLEVLAGERVLWSEEDFRIKTKAAIAEGWRLQTIAGAVARNFAFPADAVPPLQESAPATLKALKDALATLETVRAFATAESHRARADTYEVATNAAERARAAIAAAEGRARLKYGNLDPEADAVLKEAEAAASAERAAENAPQQIAPWWNDGHAVHACDASTGHGVDVMAFCDTPERAAYIAKSCNVALAESETPIVTDAMRAAMPDLLESIRPDTLDAIAREIESYDFASQTFALRSLAVVQRAALAKAKSVAPPADEAPATARAYPRYGRVLFDEAARRSGQWPFYVLDVDANGLAGCDEEHDPRAVKRDGEWRIYFETREEAQDATGLVL